ncbi:MAG: hypothetical protein R3E69_04170 [Steroidobacteraceae bacterium]
MAVHVLAGAGSLVLHAGLIGALLAPLPHREEPMADNPDAALPWVASVSIAPTAPIEAAAPSPLIEAPALRRATIDLPALPPIAVDETATDPFDLAREPESGAAAAELARLQAVYQGQLHGRLARVLEMVRASGVAVPGTCTARLLQNEHGDVMDVDLSACAYDETTKMMLAQALHRASPLPAPPTGLAMGSTLTVDVSRF